MRVFLIGFMCSGKSVVGRELANILDDHRFVDEDRAIEQRIGPILPWMHQHGESAFRVVESEVLDGLMVQENVLVACGGGTPMAADNMDRMLGAGTVVYLDVPTDVLLQRARRSGGDRPLLFGLEGEALQLRIEELMAVRRPVYRRAHLHTSAIDAPPETARGIASLLGVQVK
jgi:shikimate kinase